MGRSTIDFGIDLGTTNSVIACMDRGELLIIKNSITGADVTPSAVKADATGTMMVGLPAYNRLEEDPANAVGEFKRWMGNAGRDSFLFRKANIRMTAAELSAEVLKSLKADVQARLMGENPIAAVITVPAMFLIPACEETKTAARMAGIEICPLLQEPVAAAMAYGYRADDLKGHLLVFDLGGGTFDTTLLSAREGRMMVLGHDGYDKLGGKDYDWRIVDLLVDRLKTEYGPLDLRRGDDRARRAMAVLKHRAEDAKKTLSAREDCAVEVNNLGGHFDSIDTVVQLTRKDFERATLDLTERCLSICQRLIDNHRLTKDDIAATLIVGGQTISPYIRQAVSDHFGRAESRIDPLTVVAAGAALFASTQRLSLPKQLKSTSTKDGFEIKLAYEAVSTELDAHLGIVIQPPPLRANISLLRSDGGWSSGAIPVPENGKLITSVVLRQKKVNSFQIQLRDAFGDIIAPESGFSITHGLHTVQPTTSRGFGVALSDNTYHELIPKNSPLPARATHRFAAAHGVNAGDPDSILYIYVLQGDSPRADRNYGIGTIRLTGDSLRRNLPAGETVEVTLRLDQSNTLSAEAVFPFLNEARSEQLTWEWERPTLEGDDFQLELQREKERVAEIRNAAGDAGEMDVAVLQKEISVLENRREAMTDADGVQKAFSEILEIKQKIDAAEKTFEWQLAVIELERYREATVAIVGAAGSPAQKEQLDSQIAAAEKALKLRSLNDIKRAVEGLTDLYWEITLSQDGFWREQFEQLSDEKEFLDPMRAERLIEEGTRAVKRNDMASLRTIVIELYQLIPRWQKSTLDQRFRKAGLRLARGAGM